MAAPRLRDHKDRKQHHAAEHGDQYPGRPWVAGCSDLREAVGDAGGGDADQQESREVQRAGLSGGVAREQPDRQDGGGGADRHVDVEDPLPAGMLDEQPADGGADDRGQKHGYADGAHHPGHARRSGGLDEDHLTYGYQQATSEALDCAEGDELSW
jgi:hypothetical protein